MKKTWKTIAAILLVFAMMLPLMATAETGWVTKDEQTYFETEEGGRLTGWYQEDNVWYYLDDEGARSVGWIKAADRDAWFSFDEDGKLLGGWQKVLGVWYMYVPSEEEDADNPGKWVYVDGENIEFCTVEVGEDTLEITNTYEKSIGWQDEGENRFYFNEDGEAVTGWVDVEESSYYFDGDGVLANGFRYIDGEVADLDSEKYLANEEDELPEAEVAADAEEKNTEETPEEKAEEVEDVAEEQEKKETNKNTGKKNNKKEEEPPITVEEVIEEEIGFSTEIRSDASRFEGEEDVVIQEGEKGIKEITYTVTLNKKGEETGRVKTSEKVTKEPVKKIIGRAIKKHVIVTTEETKETDVKYNTIKENDDTRFEEDGEKVTREGKNGRKKIVYSITYTDGVETKREVKTETIVKEPVDEIISVPTKKHVSTQEEKTETEEIPFETEYVNDDTRYEDEGEIVTREGVKGIRTKVYTVTYKDGSEVSRELKSDEVTTKPVNKIISRGTKKQVITKNVTVTEVIPYETEERDWPTYEVGHNVVAQEGINGEREVVYKVTYDDAGNEVSREKVSENITKQPQKEIICVGSGVATYEYEVVSIDLSPWMHGTRSSALDAGCQSQAMTMAKNGAVSHSGQNSQGESVGGWSSASAAASGVASHGGETLAWSTNWGAGCVKVTKHKPNGATVVGYYACASGSGEIIPHD